MQDLVLIGILSILIFLAPFVHNITKIPVTVVEILLGALAMNIGIVTESLAVEKVAHIGFLFLMFLAGMEVDLKGFKMMGRLFLKQILFYFFILYSIAAILVISFDLSIIYIVAFPVMSVGMIMVLLQDYGKNYDWLNLCLKIGIIGELLSILMLVLLNGYYSYGVGLELYKSLGILIGFLLLMLFIFKFASILFWWFPSFRLMLIPNSGKLNQDIRYSMMLFFIMVVAVSILHIEAVLGAFFSGFIVASFFKYKKELHYKLNDLGFGFFIPLFFVYIGTTLDFKIIFGDLSIILHAIIFCLTMIAIHLTAASIVFGSFFKNIKNVILFALSDAMPLTFLVATATLGLNIGAIDKTQYYSFVLAAMLEAVLFMIFIKIIVNTIAVKKNQE